jgi:hypothetical protein
MERPLSNGQGALSHLSAYTHRSDYRLALESGKGVTEYQPFEPAANEIRSIWTWLRDELAIAKTDPDSRAAVA